MVTESLNTDFTKSRVEKAEKSISLLQTEWTMENHLTMDTDMFDQLNRKMSVLDIDIGEMDIVTRADLDVPLTTYVPPPPLEEQFSSIMAIIEENAHQMASCDSTRQKRPTKAKKKNK